ncbi:hypothetical protein [Ulvibacter antarcticus]|uniref:hypothetical protein n=1 Tax=Ulvibacter antarcticus TaxID=442714 RepID=UPI0011C4433E|nr:hypothetical protein [Ulvibacter antarcticus]
MIELNKDQKLIQVYFENANKEKLIEMFIASNCDRVKDTIYLKLKTIKLNSKKTDSISSIHSLKLGDSLSKWGNYAKSEEKYIEALASTDEDLKNVAYSSLSQLNKKKEVKWYNTYLLEPLLTLIKAIPIVLIALFLLVSAIWIYYHNKTKGPSLKIEFLKKKIDNPTIDELDKKLKSILLHYHFLFGQFYTRTTIVESTTSIPYLNKTIVNFPYETFVDSKYAQFIHWVINFFNKDDYILTIDLIVNDQKVSEIYGELKHKKRAIRQWNYKIDSNLFQDENFKDFAFIVFNYLRENLIEKK